jgi:hypothetical protein
LPFRVSSRFALISRHLSLALRPFDYKTDHVDFFAARLSTIFFLFFGSNWFVYPVWNRFSDLVM